jgi:hypothetical protein
MPIATRGGSIIVKDGKLAENCGCCGVTCQSLAAQDEIVISVSCQDKIVYRAETVTRQFSPTCTVGKQRGFTGFFPGNDFAGTFSLTKTSSNVWQYFYPTSAPACPHPFNSFDPFTYPNSRIRLQYTSGCNFRLLINLVSLTYCDYGQAQQRSRSQFDCTARNSNGNCESGSVYSAVNTGYAIAVNQAISLTLPGASPISLWSGDVAGPPVCSGPAESVSATTTITGSGAVSVSLVI